MNSEPLSTDRTTRLEHEWKVFDHIQTLIERADAKAGFLVGLHAILIGFLGSNLSDLKAILAARGACDWGFAVSCLALVSYGALVIVSIWQVIRVVSPRMQGDGPCTLLFAGHIASQFGKRHADYGAAVRGQSEESREHDLLCQIVDNSCIAKSKMQHVASAMRSSIAAGLTWILATCLLQLLAPAGG